MGLGFLIMDYKFMDQKVGGEEVAEGKVGRHFFFPSSLNSLMLPRVCKGQKRVASKGDVHPLAC